MNVLQTSWGSFGGWTWCNQDLNTKTVISYSCFKQQALAGQLQTQSRQTVPRVAGGLSFDLRINLLSITQHATEAFVGEPLQGFAQ